MLNPDQRRLLGGFVRAHRERLPPEGAATRRRTPGLRREELAARAGISVTWLTWIEQGRDVKASPQALERLGAPPSFFRGATVWPAPLLGRGRRAPICSNCPASAIPTIRRRRIPPMRRPRSSPRWN